jgi:hypothetical protein
LANRLYTGALRLCCGISSRSKSVWLETRSKLSAKSIFPRTRLNCECHGSAFWAALCASLASRNSSTYALKNFTNRLLFLRQHVGASRVHVRTLPHTQHVFARTPAPNVQRLAVGVSDDNS